MRRLRDDDGDDDDDFNVGIEGIQVQMKKDGLLLVGDGEPELELLLAAIS